LLSGGTGGVHYPCNAGQLSLCVGSTSRLTQRGVLVCVCLFACMCVACMALLGFCCPPPSRHPPLGLVLSTIPLRPGVWRSGPDSRVLVPCRLRSVCMGGNGTGPSGYCREHHTGPLCEVCVAHVPLSWPLINGMPLLRIHPLLNSAPVVPPLLHHPALRARVFS
jgi:hypothetical protein